MQVVIEKPVCRRLPVSFGITAVGLFCGVGAQQVVDREPAHKVLGDQVCPSQFRHRLACLYLRQPDQAGRGGREMSGPGCSDSNRNNRRAGVLSPS